MEHKQGKLKLTLGGTERVLFFDNLFLALAADDFGDEAAFEEALTKKPSKMVATLVYYAAKSGEDESAPLPEGFSITKVLQWLRDIQPETQTEIVRLYQHSMGFMFDVINNAITQKGQPSGSPSTSANS